MNYKIKTGSQQSLKKYVLDERLCTGCGACADICPYQVIHQGRTVQLHPCDLHDGRCYNYCPRTLTDFSALRHLLFDAEALTLELGAVKGYYFSRASDPDIRAMAQHGGTVTALMALALSEGLIDAAIVSSRNQDFEPVGTIAKSKDDLLRNAKSRFGVSPTVAAFNKMTKDDKARIGVVATPCQALALAKMRLKPGEEDYARISQLQLVVGLYCGWTLSADLYKKMLVEKNIHPEAVLKTDIPAGRNILEIHTKEGVHSMAMEEVQSCVREACLYCVDSTAEFADVSVGSARFAGEWEEMRQWNQLIVRTDRGRELVDLAVKNGALEIREAQAESLQELKDAAIVKKKNALKNIIRKSGSVNNLLYLDGRDPMVRKFLKS